MMEFDFVSNEVIVSGSSKPQPIVGKNHCTLDDDPTAGPGMRQALQAYCAAHGFGEVYDGGDKIFSFTKITKGQEKREDTVEGFAQSAGDEFVYTFHMTCHPHD